MNKQFVIIISITTVLLLVLLVSLALFQAKPQTDTSTGITTFPTTAPINRDSSRQYNSPTRFPTLVPEKQIAISAFAGFLPYDSDALSVAYSPISNLIYIEKKNEKADEELQRFLESHNLKDLYQKNPELFKIVATSVGEQINEDEEVLTEVDLQDFELPSSPTPTPNPNDPTNQMRPALNIFKTLMGLNMTTASTNTNNQITTSNQAPQAVPTTGTVPGAQIGSYKIRVKYDWKEAVNPICVLQPGTKSLVTYLEKNFGSSASFGIRADCKTIPSMHSDGRAVDYFFHANRPDQLKRGNEVFAWLLSNAQNIGIQYIKFWRVQWSPSTGLHCVGISPAQYKNDMYAHSNHIHFELNLAGAHQQTPFFTKGTTLPTAMIINQEICPQLDPRTK